MRTINFRWPWGDDAERELDTDVPYDPQDTPYVPPVEGRVAREERAVFGAHSGAEVEKMLAKTLERFKRF